jgi:ceramide glucosyltransferase
MDIVRSVLSLVLASLAILSLLLLCWQWLAARRFALHRHPPVPRDAPPISLLKPLKGASDSLELCLRSWLEQDYPGSVQILFGVESAEDPAVRVVEALQCAHPQRNIELVICPDLRGPNSKVAKLAKLEPLATSEILVVSDADVRVPPNLLNGLVAALGGSQVGLVNCFYRLANPSTLAMQWEAIAVNADFWSQVLQSKSLKPVDFGLGAVMAFRRRHLHEAGGFESLENYLADDFQLGNRIASRGQKISFCPLVAECHSEPMTWAQVWQHQLRWGRTIRACRPVPYFFSILANPTLWPLAWAVCTPDPLTLVFLAATVLTRGVVVMDLEQRLTGASPRLNRLWLAPVKDLLQFAVWLGAFLGNHIEWRGSRLRLKRDGTIIGIP